ncbi:hypothetical protein [Nocardia seriolae]|uniref:Uncharacterized protein n=1 Tax=Nocardia seriolae TaxID=37332 RepID=A0A0B8MZ64_9NOCA|nr:hypothetical protein [Nocardia seriolae]APB01710.1 hypothetical protein NS506_07691 [Nocardia seriolae]MTJ60822.1 hypothetical protein [Nocardia seriolae]MTJ76115.1 hypothetical protein [Nocardia seriolae]MTJ91036.1 hypothetical protein [Nocardia seriolae]MTK34998.1 hypothetical protein [Nocardia seriolae]
MNISINPARLDLFRTGPANWEKAKPLNLWALPADEIRTTLEALLDRPQSSGEEGQS